MLRNDNLREFMNWSVGLDVLGVVDLSGPLEAVLGEW